MQIVPSKRAIVFAPEDPAEVLKFIPHAKQFDLNGETMLAVHHGVEETLVLRNMGLKIAPAPILSYYDWPARVKAMTHQKETAAFLTMNRAALCLNAPGTGKTLSTLWAADFLLDQGIVRRVLIIAPLSILLPVWGRELRHHLPHRTFNIVTGTREKKEALIKQVVDFTIVNHDGFTNLASQMVGYDLVIYDEATAVKTPGAQRYRVFQRWVSNNDPWLWLLTGTPISQSPVDAWTLAKLVASPYVPRSFTAFRDMVMNKVSMFRWVPRPEALDVCKRVLQPSIRYSLDECMDLPDTSYIGRETKLTMQQERAFKDMQDSAVAVLSKGEVVAANAAIVLSKLIQISCGCVIDATGQILKVDATYRLESLIELLDEIGVLPNQKGGEKTIIFVPLRGVQDWLQAELKAKGYDVASVHGDVGKVERNKIFNDFQNTDDIGPLLAHPRVASHGLNLTRARSAIWFAPIFSLEQYEQACARIRRLTTKGRTTIFHLHATGFERELYRRLQLRKRVLADFLNLVQGINEDD